MTTTTATRRLLDEHLTPQALRALSEEELTGLAQEIRTHLIEKVSAVGGHLGPNLGAVELTPARGKCPMSAPSPIRPPRPDRPHHGVRPFPSPPPKPGA